MSEYDPMKPFPVPIPIPIPIPLDLAEALGVHPSNLSHVNAGRRQLSVPKAIKLMEISLTDDRLTGLDPTLWKDKLIWSDNFVKGLAPCYRNRNIVIPVRPDNYRKKPGQPGEEEKRREE